MKFKSMGFGCYDSKEAAIAGAIEQMNTQQGNKSAIQREAMRLFISNSDTARFFPPLPELIQKERYAAEIKRLKDMASSNYDSHGYGENRYMGD